MEDTLFISTLGKLGTLSILGTLGKLGVPNLPKIPKIPNIPQLNPMSSLLSKPIIKTTTNCPFVIKRGATSEAISRSNKFDKDYFSDKNYNYEVWQQDQARWLVSYMFDYVRPKPDWVYLDVGCALGGTVEIMRKRKAEAYGIDVSKYCIDNSPVKEYLRLGSATNIPCADQSVDVVLCTDTFQYLKKDEVRLAIQELKRITKRYVFFECITEEDKFGSQDVNPDKVRKGQSLLKRNEFIKLFEEAGFEETVRGWLPRHIQGSWLGHGWYMYDFSFNSLLEVGKK